MKKIVIIGGGIAGLSAGCYARMNGYETHILEMHTLPGGLCTSWKRKDYTFDYCIQALDGFSPDSPYYKIWEELGAIQEIYFFEMSVKVFSKGRIINFYNDPGKLAGTFKEIAPKDSNIIEEFADRLKNWYQ